MKIEKTYGNMHLLKGIGAMIVCSSHILDRLVAYNGNKPLAIESILLQPGIWYALWSGGIQVYIFCMISGFFSWHKQINNFRELLKKIIKRYINFVSLIFVGNLISYILIKCNCCPFENASIILNDNTLVAPTIDIWTIIKSSFMLQDRIHGALWMIKYMFCGNVIIYVLKYLKNYISMYIYVLYMITICITPMINYLVTVTIVGVILYEIILHVSEKKMNRGLKITAVFLLVFFIVIVQNPLGIFKNYYHVCVTIICGLICIIVQCIDINNVMIEKLIQYSKKCSTSVYSVHMPILRSLGLYILTLFNNFQMNDNLMLICVWWCTLIITLIIAYFYAKSIEKWRNEICNVLMKWISI